MLEPLDFLGLRLGWYMIFGVLAALAGTSFFVVYQRRYGLFRRPAHALLFCLWAAVLGVVGARAWSLASFAWFSGRFGSLKAYLETVTPGEVLSRGGLVWYGGFLAVLAWVLLLRRHLPAERYGNLLDVAALMGCLAQAVARIGCFLSGCCFGTWSDLPWAVIVRSGPFFSLVPRHPTNLYLSAAHALLFVVLLKRDRRKHRPGVTFMELLLGHAAIRFVNAFFRTLPEVALGLTSQQWVSLGLFTAGAVGRWLLLRSDASARSAAALAPSWGPPRSLSAPRLAGTAALVLAGMLGSLVLVDRAALAERPRPLDQRVALLDLEGEPLALAAYRGRPVVLSLWASW
ncbi:MAG: prolipoprotein diacylglyceryl transferase, partial [Acidobacteria bacterium]|nr:prolipoprotein diacylglyceryl transferase [Acidobacteriota bacterium]